MRCLSFMYKEEFIMANFVNLTPHTINILNEHDQEIMAIPANGIVARCSQSEETVMTIDGINVTRQTFGDVFDLPEPQEGTFFIVSRLVAMAAPDRLDLLIPGPLVRNDQGQPIGCHGLSVVD